MSIAQRRAPRPMEHDWHAALDGEFAVLRARVAAPDDGRCFIPAADLITPEGLCEVLDRYAARFAPEGRPAAISVWSLYHLSAVILPVVALAVLPGPTPAVAPACVGIALSADGETAAVRLASAKDGEATETGALLAAFVTGHLTPTVEALAAASGLAPRLFWNNAASYFDWMIRTAAGHAGGPRRRAEAARRFWSEPCLPGGAPNPMHGAIRCIDEDGAQVRRRKVCCLRYKLPGVAGCGSLCPLPAVRLAGA